MALFILYRLYCTLYTINGLMHAYSRLLTSDLSSFYQGVPYLIVSPLMDERQGHLTKPIICPFFLQQVEDITIGVSRPGVIRVRQPF